MHKISLTVSSYLLPLWDTETAILHGSAPRYSSPSLILPYRLDIAVFRWALRWGLVPRQRLPPAKRRLWKRHGQYILTFGSRELLNSMAQRRHRSESIFTTAEALISTFQIRYTRSQQGSFGMTNCQYVLTFYTSKYDQQFQRISDPLGRYN
jgi:hypothetical protein